MRPKRCKYASSLKIKGWGLNIRRRRDQISYYTNQVLKHSSKRHYFKRSSDNVINLCWPTFPEIMSLWETVICIAIYIAFRTKMDDFQEAWLFYARITIKIKHHHSQGHEDLWGWESKEKSEIRRKSMTSIAANDTPMPSHYGQKIASRWFTRTRKATLNRCR